jgi:tripartite-type tricarboxylate transporter receptor subunit TctC
MSVHLFGSKHARGMTRLTAVIALALMSAVATGAHAQVYPSRPITMIVPFSAGGPVDVVGRMIAERMRIALGQPVIVENVAGASGSIGAGRVARATGDGYTLAFGNWATFVANGASMALTYDLQKDFEPVSPIVTQSYMIIAKKTMPANDLKELIAWLKSNPDKALQGTSGIGTPGHVGGIFFQNFTGTRYGFVPYRGLAPAMQDLLAGQIDLMIDSPTSALPQVRGGSVKAYAVFAKTRSPAAPEIPTTDEAGSPGLYMGSWFGIWAPKGTPPDIIGRLNAAVVEALADPATRARLSDLGQDVVPREQQTPDALRALQQSEIEKWWPIIKAAGIKGG